MRLQKDSESPEPYKRGSLRHVMHLSWPLIVGMLSFTFVDVTDTLMVGWLGTLPLAAVGLATTVGFFFNAFFIGFFESVKILVAQAAGAGHETKSLGWQGLYLCVPSALLVMSSALFSVLLFSHLGHSPEVSALSAQYFSIRIFAAPFWFSMVALGSYFQGIGNTQLPMRVNLLVCGLNILFCWILIFGWGPIPALGTVGSAIATVLAMMVGSVIMFWFFWHHEHGDAHINRSQISKIVKLGLPVGVRWLLDVGGWTVAVAMMANFGPVVIAANQIATKIMHLTFLPVYGIAESAAILAGQSVGAKDVRSVYRSFRSALFFGQMIMFSFGLVFFFWGGFIVHFFEPEPAVLSLAVQILKFIAIFQLLAAVSMTTAGVLNGTGDTTYTMILSIVATWVVMVPLAYVFGFELGWGVLGMWVAVILQEVTLSLGALFRFFRASWQKIEHAQLPH